MPRKMWRVDFLCPTVQRVPTFKGPHAIGPRCQGHVLPGRGVHALLSKCTSSFVSWDQRILAQLSDRFPVDGDCCTRPSPSRYSSLLPTPSGYWLCTVRLGGGGVDKFLSTASVHHDFGPELHDVAKQLANSKSKSYIGCHSLTDRCDFTTEKMVGGTCLVLPLPLL